MTVTTVAGARRSRGLVIGLVIVAIALAGAIGMIVGAATTDDDGSRFTSRIESSCREWMGSGSAGVGDPGWCAAMAGWMDGHMPGAGMQAMMFGGSDFMLDMCQQWMATSPPSGADAIDGQAWCTGMAEWMTGRGGSGPGHMNGPMMMGG